MHDAFKDPQFWDLYYNLEPDWDEDEDESDNDEPAERLKFPLSFGSMSLCIEYAVDSFGATAELLCGRSDGDMQLMGSCDAIRAHPHCLHPDEFDLLLNHWSRNNSEADQRIALLLLAPFVGHTDPAACRALSDQVRAAFHGLYPQASAPDLSLFAREDYRWEIDGELGRLFTGKYACYSMRNREHIGVDCPPFPFTEFNRLIASIENELKS
jgi:hypothetical protein